MAECGVKKKGMWHGSKRQQVGFTFTSSDLYIRPGNLLRCLANRLQPGSQSTCP